MAELTFALGGDQEYLLHLAVRTLLGQVAQVVKVFDCYGGKDILKML